MVEMLAHVANLIRLFTVMDSRTKNHIYSWILHIVIQMGPTARLIYIVLQFSTSKQAIWQYFGDLRNILVVAYLMNVCIYILLSFKT